MMMVMVMVMMVMMMRRRRRKPGIRKLYRQYKEIIQTYFSAQALLPLYRLNPQWKDSS